MIILYTGNIWTDWLESSHKHTVETLAALPKCTTQTTIRDKRKLSSDFHCFVTYGLGLGEC